MRKLIDYFVHRPIIGNAIMFGMMLSAVLLWNRMGKEEMPEFAANWIRVSVSYPGASANDVELFITKPIEEKLKGVTDLDEVRATSSYGSSTFSIDFKADITNLPEKIQEVKDAIDTVQLPSEADDPVYRQFKSSEKAIIDIGIYLKDTDILDVKSRQLLQKYALAFKNKILTKPEISGLSESGYLRPELQVKIDPNLLEKYELTLNEVKSQISAQNLRNPIGSMKDKKESEVSILSELDSVESLKKVIISAGFQGKSLTLDQIATIEDGFEESNNVLKIQGHEGIVYSIQKSTNVDILKAEKVVSEFMEEFKRTNPNLPIDFVLMDDESYDVKNRLYLIGSNGLIGFILIVIILFFFLDFKSGIWVGMGIPFSLSFTLIASLVMGYTINNMTLAAIIIVLGIVVDDAIIVAENIQRHMRLHKKDDGVGALLEVGSPVIASVLTTCAAFLPFLFFSGHFGNFVKWIPSIIFLMLFASMVESFFILPAHMIHPLKLEVFFSKLFSGSKFTERREAFLHKVELKYAGVNRYVLHHRTLFIFGFFLLLATSVFVYKKSMRFVMFPREESRDFRIQITGPKDAKRYEMARSVKKVEELFLNDGRGIITSVQTNIGQNRRGGEVRENEASLTVEITPPSERDISLNQLLKEYEEKLKAFSEFEEVRFQRSRFGSSSGSPIAIQIQENNDLSREEIVTNLKAKLESLGYLKNVEIEKPVEKDEYRLELKKAEIAKLGIDFSSFSTTLRAYIQGDILYTLNSGEEEVDLRFTGITESKNDIDKILNLTVANKEGYLVPIKNLVTVVKRKKDANISRVNYQRATMVYADINDGEKITPLEIATKVEKEIFPLVQDGYPSAHLEFKGEVEFSRESQSDFAVTIFMVLGLIYLLLIFLFDSFVTPLLIGMIIPFGIVGSILAFYFHGMTQFGFFSVVGTLGMIGVVINDSIVLIDKLNNSLQKAYKNIEALKEDIAQISSTRLRAIFITTFTTVAGLFPTAYGVGGYDSMLAEMMLAMGWGLVFGMFITLVLVPCIYSFYAQYILKIGVGNEE